MKKQIKVMLVDDHRLVRDGIAGLLREGGMLPVGFCDNGEQAVVNYGETRPDLVLMDVNMPGMDGLEAMRAILRDYPDARIAMLTMVMLESEVMQALQAGARGYLLKTISPDSLRQSMMLMMAGETAFPSDILARGRGLSARVGPLSALTPRESEILRHLGKGKSNKSIARDLSVTEGTVKVHIKAILKKLNMANRTQAAVFAHEKGLA